MYPALATCFAIFRGAMRISTRYILWICGGWQDLPSCCKTSRDWFSVNFICKLFEEYTDPQIGCDAFSSFKRGIPSPVNKTPSLSDRNPNKHPLPSEIIKFLFFLLTFAIPILCHSLLKNESIELSAFILILILLSYSGEGGSSEYVPAIEYSVQLAKEYTERIIRVSDKSVFFKRILLFLKNPIVNVDVLNNPNGFIL